MTFNIVGGTYVERCFEGDWDQIFGSGLRAAAGITTLAETKLHTYAHKTSRKLVEVTARTFSIQPIIKESDATITFSYAHGLATPQISPPLVLIRQESPIVVNEEKVLRFGMVEGTAIVKGDMVVFDPQSAYAPESFRANGSEANRLAIVCNQRELFLLTGSNDVKQAASQLLSSERAEVVVVKCGSLGAYVHSSQESAVVPAFETERVWPIGSGDVFAAAFFSRWTCGTNAVDSANLASKYTAYYCQNRALPLPVIEDLPSLTQIKSNPAKHKPPLVYLAGPFFTMGERWLITETREALMGQGLKVFSPYHDVGIGKAMDVVPQDIKAIEEADCVFAIADHLDSGTMFEIGYARSLKKPVIIFCQNVADDDLKMMVGTQCEIIDDFVTAIYKTSWKLTQQ